MKNLFNKIKNFARKILYFVKEAFNLVLLFFFGGIIGAFILFLTAAFIRHAILFSLIVAAFFMIFQLSDLKKFFLTKNWIGFFGRLFVVFALSSYVAGFVAFFAGFIEIKADWIDILIFYISLFISYSLIIFILVLHKFFSKSSFYKSVRKIIEGLDILGVFPK